LLSTPTHWTHNTDAYQSYRTWFGADDTVPASWTSSPAVPIVGSGTGYVADIDYVGGDVGYVHNDYSGYSVRLVAPSSMRRGQLPTGSAVRGRGPAGAGHP
jgi:hypothetical protein